MQLPNLVGGSADLGPSNKTVMKNVGYFSKTDRSGRNIHFGVREHAMVTVLNGIALHGGFIPFGRYVPCFCRLLCVRRSVWQALMGLRSIFVLTHDSIALGEDWPNSSTDRTQTMSLRMIPGLSVFRPADALETAAAWQMACMNLHKPTALLLSRQKLPVLHEYAANRPRKCL